MSTTRHAVLAGGCFWGMEDLFRKRSGVVDTEVGYAGGAEALRIAYDPEKTSYRDLLDFFFQIHDPTTMNRQGNDVGTSYRSAIFYANEEEKREAEAFVAIVNASGRWDKPVVTSLEPLTGFSPAEGYHQNSLEKNPGGYTCHYARFGSYLTG